MRSASPADLAACRASLRGGSRSFHVASKFLPRDTADAAIALYAFCRLADDLIDQEHAEGGSGAALAELRERLRLASAGSPLDVPTDRAIAWLMPRYGIPYALMDALLDGFAWDAARRQYESYSDVVAYSTRVAGTVGAMMALLMDVRGAAAVARAIDLGVAMQLSNIARDVGEDARAGRLYLPRAWLREAGIDPDGFLARPVFSPALGEVVTRLLVAAERLYLRADAGIAALPSRCRPGIRAARVLYREIGCEVARAGGDSVSRRAVVPASRKARVLARGIMPAPVVAAHATAPVIPEARFLVDAVLAAPWRPAPSASAQARPAMSLDERVAWVFDLFGRLEGMQVGQTRPT
jgi:phytoene synthase